MSTSLNSTVPKLSPECYQFGKELGEGSFSTVYIARHISSNEQVAIKVCEQRHIIHNKATDVIMTEKEAMTRINQLDCPYFVKLMCTMKDSKRLYFVMTYCPQGELLHWLKKLSNFSIECSAFYCAELLEAIMYLNSIGIVHRDIKPENCYLMDSFHLKVGDFGSAFITGFSKCPRFTGTPHYASPEMLTLTAEGDHNNLYVMDLWALGCCCYQFLSGRPPFRGHGDHDIIQKVCQLNYEFPAQFPEVAKNLVQKLLVKDPTGRLGSPQCGGFEAVKKHPFFANIPFGYLTSSAPPKLTANLPPLVTDINWSVIPTGYDEGVRYQFSLNFPTMFDIGENDREKMRREQEIKNIYHRFCRQQIIIKQGFLFKRRGLFARKRMFLLTYGPHLFYVDSDKMELKGEVPWSTFTHFELKDSKLLFIHTPNRTYHLEDPSGAAQEWMDQLSKVKQMYFKEDD